MGEFSQRHFSGSRPGLVVFFKNIFFLSSSHLYPLEKRELRYRPSLGERSIAVLLYINNIKGKTLSEIFSIYEYVTFSCLIVPYLSHLWHLWHHLWCFFLGWGRFLRLCVFGLASSPPTRLLSVPHCSAHRSQTRSDCSRQYEGDSVFCASKYFPQYHSVHCGIIKLNCLISFPLQRNWQTQHFRSLFFNCNL